MNVYQQISKLAIAKSFSNAALSYDQAASLQRRIGQQLLDLIPNIKVSQLVDLGCGTGYFASALQSVFPHAKLIGIDLAEGMVTQAKQQNKKMDWLVGDAESLPLADQRVDLVFSNLAVQWCHDFSKVLQEAYRVLKPQGILAFTSLCKGTLYELEQSWRVVDEHRHVNKFLSFSHYEQLLKDSNFVVINTYEQKEQGFYETLRLLMQDLKAIGAHNMNPSRHKGLTGIKALQSLQEAYELFRTEQGLPISYQVVYGLLIKES